VAHGTPCLGPITQAGCGAICPAFGRGCYGCFGPVAAPNLTALVAQLRRLGMTGDDVDRVLSTFNAAAPALASHRRQPAGLPGHVRRLGKLAQERVGEVVTGHADARVHGDDAVRAGDHGVEVKLGDLRQVIGEP
jgi:hypothetical protein